MNKISSIIDQHLESVKVLYDLEEQLMEVSNKIITTIESGNKILVMGNGGSAADSQHFAAEIVGKFEEHRRGFPCIALTTDSSILTSTSNDLGYSQVFARQIEAIGEPGDLILGISTSGNSANIVEGIKEGKSQGCSTAGLLGRDGGKLKQLVDHAIVPAIFDTARIQECHIVILHIFCYLFDQHYKSS
jgi:phosphoheptose isomerase